MKQFIPLLGEQEWMFQVWNQWTHKFSAKKGLQHTGSRKNPVQNHSNGSPVAKFHWADWAEATGWQEARKDTFQGHSKAGCVGRGRRDPEKGEQNVEDAEDEVWKGCGEAGDQKALMGTDGSSFPNVFPLSGCLCLALSALHLTT